jgi:hypothetical protein
MTRAKKLLFNVTLLVQPGLEPKIARLGGPHGVSCGRGLNPRHGPLQHQRYRNHRPLSDNTLITKHVSCTHANLDISNCSEKVFVF